MKKAVKKTSKAKKAIQKMKATEVSNEEFLNCQQIDNIEIFSENCKDPQSKGVLGFLYSMISQSGKINNEQNVSNYVNEVVETELQVSENQSQQKDFPPVDTKSEQNQETVLSAVFHKENISITELVNNVEIQQEEEDDLVLLTAEDRDISDEEVDFLLENQAQKEVLKEGISNARTLDVTPIIDINLIKEEIIAQNEPASVSVFDDSKNTESDKLDHEKDGAETLNSPVVETDEMRLRKEKELERKQNKKLRRKNNKNQLKQNENVLKEYADESLERKRKHKELVKLYIEKEKLDKEEQKMIEKQNRVQKVDETKARQMEFERILQEKIEEKKQIRLKEQVKIDIEDEKRQEKLRIAREKYLRNILEKRRVVLEREKKEELEILRKEYQESDYIQKGTEDKYQSLFAELEETNDFSVRNNAPTRARGQSYNRRPQSKNQQRGLSLGTKVPKLVMRNKINVNKQEKSVYEIREEKKDEQSPYQKRERNATPTRVEKKDEQSPYQKRERNATPTRARQINKYQKDGTKRNTSKPKKVPTLKNQTYKMKDDISNEQVAPRNARERRREKRALERDIKDDSLYVKKDGLKLVNDQKEQNTQNEQVELSVSIKQDNEKPQIIKEEFIVSPKTSENKQSKFTKNVKDKVTSDSSDDEAWINMWAKGEEAISQRDPSKARKSNKQVEIQHKELVIAQVKVSKESFDSKKVSSVQDLSAGLKRTDVKPLVTAYDTGCAGDFGEMLVDNTDNAGIQILDSLRNLSSTLKSRKTSQNSIEPIQNKENEVQEIVEVTEPETTLVETVITKEKTVSFKNDTESDEQSDDIELEIERMKQELEILEKKKALQKKMTEAKNKKSKKV